MIVIIVGTLLALSNWKSITHKVIKQASITNAYRKVYREFESYSGIGIRSLMSNKLNYYIIIPYIHCDCGLWIYFGWLSKSP